MKTLPRIDEQTIETWENNI